MTDLYKYMNIKHIAKIVQKIITYDPLRLIDYWNKRHNCLTVYVCITYKIVLPIHKLWLFDG